MTTNQFIKHASNFNGLNQFMEKEHLKNKIDRKRRSLSEGMSTKEEDTDERDDDDIFLQKHHP